MKIVSLLDTVNRRHGTTYMLGERFPFGTRGAYAVADANGRRAVFKAGPGAGWLARLRQAEVIAARLRAGGYPIPRNFVLGTTADHWYQVQEYITGTPLAAPLSATNLDHLLWLNDRQAGQHRADDRDWANWSQYARDVVFADGSGWAGTLHAHSPATRALLAALHEMTRSFSTAALPTDDVVHGDFVAENVLAHEGRIAAVIDFAAAGCGSRALDLARLLMWWYADIGQAGQRRLIDRIAAITTPAERAIYTAYAVIDVVAFVIAHHPADVTRIVRRGYQLLEPFGMTQ